MGGPGAGVVTTGAGHLVILMIDDPQVQAEAVSGPDCRIKAAQVLPCGARLDIKLDELAAAEENVLVWFYACSNKDDAWSPLPPGEV